MAGVAPFFCRFSGTLMAARLNAALTNLKKRVENPAERAKNPREPVLSGSGLGYSATACTAKSAPFHPRRGSEEREQRSGQTHYAGPQIRTPGTLVVNVLPRILASPGRA